MADETDHDAERLINELLTRVGMIMEDVGPTALLNDSYAGDLPAGLVGRDTLNSRVVRQGGYDFGAPAWVQFRKDRELISSFMAPVAYGPSAKVGLGVGVITPVVGGAFLPVEEVMPAVLALDEQLRPALAEPAFAALEGSYVSLDDMRRYYPYWSASDLTAREVKVGRSRLYEKQNAEPRRYSIDLVRHLMETAGRALTLSEVRRALASGHIDNRDLDPPGQLARTADLWRALAARQLLRLSLESLLNWVLAECAIPSSVESLGGRLFRGLGSPNYNTVADWIASRAWSSTIADPVRDPVELMEELEFERQSDRPELALDGLKAALAIASEATDTEPYQGQIDRLSLSTLLARLDQMRTLSFEEGLETILAEWVIGQHVYWAVGRSGDDMQRLRLMLDEGGWLSFYAAPGNARATADRLQTTLRLMADCGLAQETWDGPDPRYQQ